MNMNYVSIKDTDTNDLDCYRHGSQGSRDCLQDIKISLKNIGLLSAVVFPEVVSCIHVIM